MPQRKNNSLRRSRHSAANAAAPATMTWTKATPVLAVCLVFDAVRFLFEQFWFFGPALAGIYCTATVTGWVGAVWGLVPAACAAGAAATGYFLIGPLEAFGIVMAIAIGLFGWLTVATLLMITNSRVFKENALWFAGSLLVSVAPVIGTLPALVVIVWRMYHRQIKKEKAILKKYQQEQAAAQAEKRRQRLAEFAGEDAENEATFGEIPEEMPAAA